MSTPPSYAATAFAFCTSFGRFVGARVNFLPGAAVLHTHALGLLVALTAVVFVIGLFIIAWTPETPGTRCRPRLDPPVSSNPRVA